MSHHYASTLLSVLAYTVFCLLLLLLLPAGVHPVCAHLAAVGPQLWWPVSHG
jgi:hypothetical protein